MFPVEAHPVFSFGPDFGHRTAALLPVCCLTGPAKMVHRFSMGLLPLCQIKTWFPDLGQSVCMGWHEIFLKKFGLCLPLSYICLYAKSTFFYF
jgi:hypothetical protein